MDRTQHVSPTGGHLSVNKVQQTVLDAVPNRLSSPAPGNQAPCCSAFRSGERREVQSPARRTAGAGPAEGAPGREAQAARPAGPSEVQGQHRQAECKHPAAPCAGPARVTPGQATELGFWAGLACPLLGAKGTLCPTGRRRWAGPGPLAPHHTAGVTLPLPNPFRTFSFSLSLLGLMCH